MQKTLPLIASNRSERMRLHSLGSPLFWVLLLLAIALFESAYSQEDAPAEIKSEIMTLKGVEPPNILPVDIPTLVQLLTERSIDIAITDSQIDQAKGYLNQSIAGLLPSIRMMSQVERIEGGEIFIGPTPFSVDRVTHQPRISVDYQIPLGGKAIYRISAARFQVQRSRTIRSKTVQSALLEALTQYFTLLRDAANVEIARQALREADAQVAFNEARYRAGFATLLDVAQSKTLQAHRKNEVLKAENSREITAIMLGSLLDLPLTLTVEPSSSSAGPIVFLAPDTPLERLYQMAIENRPDLKELDFAIKEAKAQYGIVRSDFFPTLTLSAYRRGVGPNLNNLQQTDQTFSSVSVDFLRNLGWDVLSGMQISRARIQEAILKKEKQLNEMQRSLAEAYRNCSLYQAQMKVAEQAIETALESYRIAGVRLKGGVGLNLDLIEAQKELTTARMEYQAALMNFNIAQLRLLYETGQLTPHNILFGLKSASVAPAHQALPPS